MAMTETDIATEPSATGGRRHRIWVLQFGPCWCHGAPRDDASFDFVRLRKSEVSHLDSDVVVVSRRIVIGSEGLVRQIHDRLTPRRLVITTAHCPPTAEFWDHLPGGWIEAEELIPVDVRVGQCFSGYPEVVMAGILDGLGGAGLSDRSGSVWETAP